MEKAPLYTTHRQKHTHIFNQQEKKNKQTNKRCRMQFDKEKNNVQKINSKS